MTGLIVRCDHVGKMGRLGNALFQIAATAGVADTLGGEPRFNADWCHRPYFSVPDELFATEPGLDVTEVGLTRHIDPRARGYLQDVRLFEHVMPTLSEWFLPSIKALEMMRGREADVVAVSRELPRPILSIHVRRTDKVPGQDKVEDGSYHRCAPLGYYLAAIERFEQAESFVVFSDEPDWAETHLSPVLDRRGPALFVQGTPAPKEHEPEFRGAVFYDHIDLQLMQMCDMHICTGSTFGLWGAMLAGTQQATIAAPVYGPKLGYIDDTILHPPHFQRLIAGKDY